MSVADLYRHLWAALGEGSLEELDTVEPPRGPDWIFELTDSLELPAEARVLDLGCGPGEQAAELARRYSIRPICVDPLPGHLEAARGGVPAGGVSVRVAAARMERIPLASESIDLVWLRDALLHSTDPEETASECYRVLRPGGSLLLHAAFATDKLAPHELDLLRTDMNVVEASLDRELVDIALERAGFETRREEELGSELAEFYEGKEGLGARALSRLARLERGSEELRARLGEERYRSARGVYHWIVFELMGKLSYRTSLLRKPRSVTR